MSIPAVRPRRVWIVVCPVCGKVLTVAWFAHGEESIWCWTCRMNVPLIWEGDDV